MSVIQLWPWGKVPAGCHCNSVRPANFLGASLHFSPTASIVMLLLSEFYVLLQTMMTPTTVTMEKYSLSWLLKICLYKECLQTYSEQVFTG